MAHVRENCTKLYLGSLVMSKLSGSQLIHMKNAVVENFDSTNWRELAALTNMLDEVEQHPRLLRSLNFGDDDYEGLALRFLRKMIGSGDENLHTVQRYIEQKCPELGNV